MNNNDLNIRAAKLLGYYLAPGAVERDQPLRAQLGCEALLEGDARLQAEQGGALGIEQELPAGRGQARTASNRGGDSDDEYDECSLCQTSHPEFFS